MFIIFSPLYTDVLHSTGSGFNPADIFANEKRLNEVIVPDTIEPAEFAEAVPPTSVQAVAPDDALATVSLL